MDQTATSTLNTQPEVTGVTSAPIGQAPAPENTTPVFGSGDPNPSPTLTPQTSSTTTTSNSSGGSGKRRRVILIALAIMLMLGGIATGTYLIRQQQLGPSFAWDCSLYNFAVDENGSVTVVNGSLRDEPAQSIDVYINGTLAGTFDVPALSAGEGATVGTVTVPQNGQFTWRATGSKDCEDSGSHVSQNQQAQCLAINAYDEDWNALTSEDLKDLSTGDVVRFTVAGSTTSGSFSKARFTINGDLMDEVTQTRPGSSDFYYEYTIPAGETTFSVGAELYHPDIGWF